MKHSYLAKDKHVFHIDTIGTKFYLILEGTVGVYIRLQKRRNPLLHGGNNCDTPRSPLGANTPRTPKTPISMSPSSYRPAGFVWNQSNSLDEQLVCVKQLEAGTGFGELALISNKPRLATIICHSNCHFATLDQKEFAEILREKEEEKLIKEMGFFASLPLFQTWNFNLIKILYLSSVRLTFTKGEAVYKEGSDPLAVYIIAQGDFIFQKAQEIKKEENDEDESSDQKNQASEGFDQFYHDIKKPVRQIKVAVYSSPELFGEEEIMLDEDQRRYSAVCGSAYGHVIMIRKKDFEMKVLSEEKAFNYLNTRLAIKSNRFARQVDLFAKQLDNYRRYLYEDNKNASQNLSENYKNKDELTRNTNGSITLLPQLGIDMKQLAEIGEDKDKTSDSAIKSNHTEQELRFLHQKGSKINTKKLGYSFSMANHEESSSKRQQQLKINRLKQQSFSEFDGNNNKNTAGNRNTSNCMDSQEKLTLQNKLQRKRLWHCDVNANDEGLIKKEKQLTLAEVIEKKEREAGYNKVNQEFVKFLEKKITISKTKPKIKNKTKWISETVEIKDEGMFNNNNNTNNSDGSIASPDRRSHQSANSQQLKGKEQLAKALKQILQHNLKNSNNNQEDIKIVTDSFSLSHIHKPETVTQQQQEEPSKSPTFVLQQQLNYQPPKNHAIPIIDSSNPQQSEIPQIHQSNEIPKYPSASPNLIQRIHNRIQTSSFSAALNNASLSNSPQSHIFLPNRGNITSTKQRMAIHGRQQKSLQILPNSLRQQQRKNSFSNQEESLPRSLRIDKDYSLGWQSRSIGKINQIVASQGDSELEIPSPSTSTSLIPKNINNTSQKAANVNRSINYLNKIVASTGISSSQSSKNNRILYRQQAGKNYYQSCFFSSNNTLTAINRSNDLIPQSLEDISQLQSNRITNEQAITTYQPTESFNKVGLSSQKEKNSHEIITTTVSNQGCLSQSLSSKLIKQRRRTNQLSNKTGLYKFEQEYLDTKNKHTNINKSHDNNYVYDTTAPKQQRVFLSIEPSKKIDNSASLHEQKDNNHKGSQINAEKIQKNQAEALQMKINMLQIKRNQAEEQEVNTAMPKQNWEEEDTNQMGQQQN